MEDNSSKSDCFVGVQCCDENNVKVNSAGAVCEVTVCTNILGKNFFLIDHLKNGITFIVHKVRHSLYGHFSENWWRKERITEKVKGSLLCVVGMWRIMKHIFCVWYTLPLSSVVLEVITQKSEFLSMLYCAFTTELVGGKVIEHMKISEASY